MMKELSFLGAYTFKIHFKVCPEHRLM